MTRAEFLTFLEENGCTIARQDKSGYSVCRNVINGLMSGVPKNDPLKPATVCRILKTLGIEELPDDEEVRKAKPVIDLAHKNHSNN